MKLFKLTFLLTVLMSMVGVNVLAHDFEVANADGKTIYYVKTSDTEVAVSFKGARYYDYSDEYSGNVVIPELVFYKGNYYHVTSIYHDAFNNCPSLTSVTIPNSVTSIDYFAFLFCYGLSSITIPQSVTYISSEAFISCRGLVSINVESGNTAYDSRQNCNAIIEKLSNKLIAGCKNSFIPNGVKEIGDDAFSDCIGLKSIDIPNSVEKIGFNSFQDCRSLTSIIIPNSVTSIGTHAFQYCNNLTSVTVEWTEPISINSNDTFSNSANATLYVPSGSKAAYEAADYWKDFKEIVEPFNPTNMDISQVSTGSSHHTMILNTDGSLWACGRNNYGQLGDGTTTNCSTPKQVMSGVEAVSTGFEHTMILKADGSLWACGHNGYGQLGDGTTSNCSTPKQIMTGVAAVSAGGYHTMILKTDGSLWACGYNYYGSLGDGTTTNCSTPKQIMTGVAAVATGYYHTMILKTDGLLWACGNNGSGQLGDGTITNKSTPQQIMSNVVAVSTGFEHTMILKADGSLWACGLNELGQLCDGTTNSTSTPNSVMMGVAAVSAGSAHTMILKTDGSLWACGYNNDGELGDGTTNSNSIPQRVMTGVAAVAAGYRHTMILKTDGSLWACGRNNCGQLGDGTYTNRSTPVLISQNISGVVNPTNISTLDNVIYLDEVQAVPGSQKTVSIKMKNTATIRGFQFNMTLPEGVTPATYSNGTIICSLSDARRSEGDQHTISVSQQTDGSYLFLCNSTANETFTGNDGEVLTLKINIADNMAAGDYPITLSSIKLSETNISNYYETAEVVSKLTISDYVLGDISGDGVVDVSDYIGVANHILGNTPAGFNALAADVNGDHVIDISDYIGVANIILTGSIYGDNASSRPHVESEEPTHEPQ